MLSETIFTSASERENRKELGDLWLKWGQAFKIVLASQSLRFWPWKAFCPPGTGFKVDFSTHKAAPPPPTLLVTTAGEMILFVPWHVALTWLSQASLPAQKERWVCGEDGHLLTLCTSAGAQPRGIGQCPPLQLLFWKWNETVGAISLGPFMSNKFTVKAAETKPF